MNRVTLKLRCFSLLFVKRGSAAPPSVARCDFCSHRTQFFRTIATNNNDMEKSKQIKLSRRLKVKQQRSDTDGGTDVVYVQVLGAGSRDSPSSLFVFSSRNRYLFNCGEGIQRLMQEHKLKATRINGIFLTSVSWENVGGVPGLCMTLNNYDVPECVLSGPPELEDYLKAIKHFATPVDNIKLHLCNSEPYSDNMMTVHQVPVFGKKVPANGKVRMLASFICQLNPKSRRFLVDKAKELGLFGEWDFNPLIKDLKLGKSVVYKGKEIRPEQVCAPTEPGPVFIVVECPSEEFLDDICTNQQLRRHQTGGTEDAAVLVVHMTPESILSTDQYKGWMERFPSSTEHLILNKQDSTVHNIHSNGLQAQLSMIHPKIFPPLKAYKTKEPQAVLNVPHVRAECLLKFQLRPVMEWQRDAIPSYKIEEFVKEASEVPNFLEEVDKCRKFCSTDVAQLSGQGEKYPEVIFLGTGSAAPNKIRNVSATLVNISPSQSIMLDCGEGTFGQLCRHYGDDVDEALSKISTVFVSHLHADHHSGLPQLLYQRQQALTTLGKTFSCIFLVAPAEIMTWLRIYHNSCETILHHINLIPNHFLTGSEAPDAKTKHFIRLMLKKNELEKFQTCWVLHYGKAFACSFTHQSGWKLAFSGDTMPCSNFVDIGKDANLVIHEATMEDGLESDAVEKRHSTASQAINIGLQMNAEFIMLNHFSQRYPKIPVFSEDFTDRVGIAFDHMTIRFGDFKTLPRLIPALKTLFAVELNEMGERMEKKKEKRKERMLSAGRCYDEAWTSNECQGAKRDKEEEATHDVEIKRMKSS